MNRTYKIAILCIHFLVTFGILLYLLRIGKRADQQGIVQRAAIATEFKQCEFIVYDKSSETACDRLIFVTPFDWLLWNTRKNLYVLYPERKIQCSGRN